MCMYFSRSPSSRRPSFWTTRRLAVFSGRMLISTRCRPRAKKQWSAAIATATGVIPRPATRESIQYPICPDRIEPQLSPDTVI